MSAASRPQLSIELPLMYLATLHAFISGGAALYHLRNETLKSNPVFGFDSSVGQLCAFSMGYVFFLSSYFFGAIYLYLGRYFIWDTIDSIRNSTIGFVAHGIASVALFLFTFVCLLSTLRTKVLTDFLASIYGWICPYFPLVGTINSLPQFPLVHGMSAPSCDRVMADDIQEKLGVKNTHPTLFTINAAIFALIFFLARICHGNYSVSLFLLFVGSC